MNKALGLLIALLLALTGQAAVAQNFPKLTGRVVDEANLLDPQQEAALSAKLEGLEARTKRQLVVTTLASLEGYEISDYGYRLGRAWAIGQDGKGETEKDNGAILIVAPNERKLRIEVGYGLEPVLTDGLSSTIIRNDITPRFKEGDFAGGINAGVDRIVTQFELPADEAAKIASAAQQYNKRDKGIPVGAIIFILFMIFFVFLPMIRSTNGGGRKHRRAGMGPVIIWGGGGFGAQRYAIGGGCRKALVCGALRAAIPELFIQRLDGTVGDINRIKGQHHGGPVQNRKGAQLLHHLGQYRDRGLEEGLAPLFALKFHRFDFGGLVFADLFNLGIKGICQGLKRAGRHGGALLGQIGLFGGQSLFNGAVFGSKGLVGCNGARL